MTCCCVLSRRHLIFAPLVGALMLLFKPTAAQTVAPTVAPTGMMMDTAAPTAMMDMLATAAPTAMMMATTASPTMAGNNNMMTTTAPTVMMTMRPTMRPTVMTAKPSMMPSPPSPTIMMPSPPSPTMMPTGTIMMVPTMAPITKDEVEARFYKMCLKKTKYECSCGQNERKGNKCTRKVITEYCREPRHKAYKKLFRQLVESEFKLHCKKILKAEEKLEKEEKEERMNAKMGIFLM